MKPAKCPKYTAIETNEIPLPGDTVALDGFSLQPEALRELSKGAIRITLADTARECVMKSRAVIDEIVANQTVAYGINTGFGLFAHTIIDHNQLFELQENLICSHAAGVGSPLSPEHCRGVAQKQALLALRINVLAKGHSGISLDSLEFLVNVFNKSCLPWVPEKGSVGASGDLAPLAHLALGIIGKGKMWSPETGWDDAEKVLQHHELTPLKLGAKEGLAMINGTQMITSFGAEALVRSEILAKQADIIVALTLEVLKGSTRAFDSDIQNVRPHMGQREVAWRLRSLLHSTTHPSEIAESHRFCDKVQDAYTLRCAPQVHGITNDTLAFVRGIITTEMNSATDNPLVFPERNECISGGNFHGEYPAKAMDYLAIAVHELASMSERRTERLMNPSCSGLPAFLTPHGGLNSGFMMAHVTAAALVSENKVLCHPSSVDTLPTSAGQEDHVSMGTYAARKAIQVVENVENVLAVELLCACQAIEFLRPLKTTAPLEAVYSLVRTKVEPWTKDRHMSPNIDIVVEMLRNNQLWDTCLPYMEEYRMSQGTETRSQSPTASFSNLRELVNGWG